MTETTPGPNTPPAAAAPKPQSAWVKWGTFGAGIALAITGIVQLLSVFTLPACNSQRASDTVRAIYKGQNVELTKLSDLKTISSSRAENVCEGDLETADEQATIGYKVFWDGWTVKVMVTDVKAQPKRPA